MLWKAIRKLWAIVNTKVYFILFYFIYFMGNGRRINFLKDRWCGDELLYVSFPFLHALASSKEA